MHYRIIAVAFLVLAISACGGSGTTSDQPADAPTDAAVSAATEATAPTEVPATEVPEVAAVGTRDNPVPIGTAATVGKWEITVTAVNPNAADVVAAENQFNDPPAEGSNYVLISVKATYNGEDSGTFWVENSSKVLGTGGNTFDDSCGVIPNPIMDAGETFAGATIDANMCFSVETAQLDGATLIMEPSFSFGDDSRMFFALK